MSLTSLSGSEKQFFITRTFKRLISQASVNLEEVQIQSVRKFLVEYQDVFALTDEQLGKTEVVRHEINNGTAKPSEEGLRRVPHYAVDEVDRQVDDMLKRGIIEPSNSPWVLVSSWYAEKITP